jgi:hypothetical protein
MSQTRWISGFALLAVLSTPLGARPLRPPTPTVVGSVSHLLLPTSANVNGQFGALFRTKVSIFNPTTYAYTIRAGLSTRDGEAAVSSISMQSGETRTFDNFVADVFGSFSAGAIDLDSGDDLYRFIVSAQVYVDTGAGRFTTSVQFADDLGTVTPERPGYVVGVSVNSNFRTNIGCASNSSAPQTITLRAFDSDFYLVGDPFSFTMAGFGWAQYSVNIPLRNGGIVFEATRNAVCFAVEVNNVSNDGTYQLAIPF